MPCYKRDGTTGSIAAKQLNEKRNLFKLYMNDVGLHTELVEIKSGSDFKKASGNGSCRKKSRKNRFMRLICVDCKENYVKYVR